VGVRTAAQGLPPENIQDSRISQGSRLKVFFQTAHSDKSRHPANFSRRFILRFLCFLAAEYVFSFSQILLICAQSAGLPCRSLLSYGEGGWGFVGHSAPDEIANLYLRHRIPDAMRNKRGAANPVKYTFD
jgi:hypothetical protein